MDQIQIADYLAKNVFNKELKDIFYIMLINRQIYSEPDYDKLVKSNQISPEDAFMYIDFNNISRDESYNVPVEYLFPLIDALGILGIVISYLDKLGFDNPNYNVYPATGLKYYAVVRLFSDRLVIEIVDIDTVATNTRLGKIITDVLGKDILTQTQKEINTAKSNEITVKLQQQKLFAGYNFKEAYDIIFDYYKNHNTSLAKEVLAITNTYNKIFQPYRVVYDTRTRRQVLM
jgi:hypothetical protein